MRTEESLKVPLANWNGEEMPLDQVRVSVLDRAFMFGDAVYEALRIYEGRPWLLEEHQRRLESSLRELRIECDVGRLARRLVETIAHSGAKEGLAYFQVTRGVAPRRHAFPQPPVPPNELIYVEDYGADPYAALRPVGAKVVTYPDCRWARRDIKSTNLLGNCLAAQAAVEAGGIEAILIEADGLISEASHSSVFAVKERKLWTAPNSHHILPGITRGLVLRLAAAAEIPVVERPFHQDDLPMVDELFLTGTSTEVLAIRQVDDRPVGDGKPGPVTRRLAETYRRAVSEWLARGPSS